MKRRLNLLILALILPTGLLILGVERFALAQLPTPRLEDLAPFPLAGHRLLILAPHDDDETLGAGGLIMAALRQGLEVRVVIATNGDGYLFATIDDFHKLFPNAQDYISLGNQRQQESLAALKTLGLSAKQVSFLSYPDRGLPALWETHWPSSNPYRSPYTKASKSPYTITYDPDAVYAGQDLLNDLRSIIESYRPDLIIYPHPNEVHPDHWGLNVFVRLALALSEQAQPDYQPAAYVYLIHRPDYPHPQGYRPTASLLPPPSLYALDRNWLRLDLSEDDIQQKQAAVNQYRTQLPVLGRLMESFVRRNELFSRLTSANLPILAEGDALNPAIWRAPDGEVIPPIQRDPADDTFVRTALANADLIALYAAQTPDETLVICAEARSSIGPSPELNHLLRVKAAGSTGLIDYVATRHGGKNKVRAKTRGHYVCTQTPLENLGQPDLLVIGAEVQGFEVGLIDQIAWQVVYRR